ncbi:YqaJ viral recombinase family protein [Aromatoleum evansii]|uniref:YqaJ viral recombinase family protein n=1 Tax=Aromatoleum evansii TaxID=59406 RepID=A0ABZ1ASY3_AROEV|nr:YqaJ viral recombinase family protein [Aromatoleum evansii]WRL48324.1 YqaJ viral recombinase family protein [Aromatoleum evansii]
MIIINVQQGTPEWHSARAKCFNASEAPAMMGVSPYMTRSELLRQKATGIVPDVDPATQRRFDDGHAAEAMARLLVEQNITGEDLYPIVATDDTGRLLASSDGATMLYDTGFEHKLWNEELAAQVRDGIVPESHRWQLDQQIAVFGFEKIIFVVSDGTTERFVWCAYRTTPERIARLMAGWEQFERDLAEYVPEPAAEAAPVGCAPEALPALRIEVTGMVTASNLEAFREHALAVFSGIKTDLQTDADFADAERTVKWCKEVEDRLDAAKQHALSQTATIDELFRTIDAIKEEARQKRLTLDRLVKSEKEARKLQIVTQAHQALVAHVQQLNARIAPASIPSSMYAPQMFGEAVKGLKSLDSMRDKVGTLLANAKVECNAVADRIDANRKTVEDMSLMPDFAVVCTKSTEDFAALLAMRVNARREAEEKRLAAERERIRAEEEAKAQRTAREAQAEMDRQAAAARAAEQAKLDAERAELRRQQEFIEAEQRRQRDAATVQAAKPAEKPEIVVAAVSEESDEKITLGQINARLAPVKIDAAGLAQIGFHPVGKERAAVLYRESDVSRICAALVRHLSAVSGQMREAA